MDYIEKLQVKRRRDKRIAAMAKKKPQAEVARHYGISQQRVAQIVDRERESAGKAAGGAKEEDRETVGKLNKYSSGNNAC